MENSKLCAYCILRIFEGSLCGRCQRKRIQDWINSVPEDTDHLGNRYLRQKFLSRGVFPLPDTTNEGIQDGETVLYGSDETDYLEIASDDLNPSYQFDLGELFGSSMVQASANIDKESILQDKYYEYLSEQSGHFLQPVSSESSLLNIEEMHKLPINQMESISEDETPERLRNFRNFHERTMPKLHSLRLLTNSRQEASSEMVVCQAGNRRELSKIHTDDSVAEIPCEETGDAKKVWDNIGEVRPSTPRRSSSPCHTQ